MTNTILKQVESGTYTNSKGVGTFAAHDVYPGANAPARKGVRIGDTNGISVQVSAATERTRNSNEYATATPILSFVGEKEITVRISSVQMTNLTLSAAVMGQQGVQMQAEATGVEVDLPEVGVWMLRHFSIQNVVVMKGVEEAVLGDDYMIDTVSGQIETLVSGLSATYDAPEINEGFITGIASGDGIRGTLMFRGVNAQGRRVQMLLHDVQLRPTGQFDLVVDGEEEQVVELEGKAYPVPGQRPGMAIGWMRDITEESAL